MKMSRWASFILFFLQAGLQKSEDAREPFLDSYQPERMIEVGPWKLKVPTEMHIIFIGVYRRKLWLAASKLLICQVPEAFAQARGDLIQFLQFPAMSAHILTQASMQSNKKIFSKH